MAFESPFFQSTQAQGIINNYLNNMSGGLPPYTTPSTNPYLVDSTPFVPPAAQPSPDPTVPNCEELYPGEGRVYDPVLQACVIAEVAPEELNGDSDNETTPSPYEGVGSVYSPEQNAFMNLGLGGSTADDVQSYFDPNDPNKKLDLYGDGLSGLYKRFTPFGQLGVYLDAKRLADAGVINKRDDGGYSWAKGGNLNLVQANQAFENQLAKDNMMDFAQNTLGRTEEEAQAMADVTTRGDKADDMGNVYAGLNVTSQPFQSDFGASTIKSYSNNLGDTSGGRSMQNFNRRQKYKDTAKTGAKAGFRYGL
tara:strand:- start:48 stop:971 length:924 start_codon:yes stop_codon:yes gene_type:complete